MKKQVGYDIFCDMEKNIKNFDPNQYSITEEGHTSEAVRKAVKEYYEKHLPVDFWAWERVVRSPYESESKLPESMISLFSNLCVMFVNERSEDIITPKVIALPKSMVKPIIEPVVQFDIKELGLEIIFKGTAMGLIWYLSVKSDNPIEIDFGDLFDTAKKPVIDEWGWIGFPKDKLYGAYEENHSRFSFKIRSSHDLYIIAYVIKKSLEKFK